MTTLPTVSVVLPVKNEQPHIEETLAALQQQDYQGSLEFVVADGGSSDDTRAILDRIAAEDGRLTVVDNAAGTTAAGLNAAIAASSGAVIVRCDGHARFGADYVSTAVGVLQETGAGNVGGVQAAEGTGFVQRAIAIAMTSPLGVGNSRFHYAAEPGPADTVYLGTFDRPKLEAVGGFDETLLRNQDYELNHRLIEAGHTIWFDPRLRVSYTPRASIAGLWRQYFDYGTWKRVMLSRSPRALKPRQLAPPLLVIALLASLVLWLFGSPAAVAVPSLYGLFLALGSLIELIRRRDVAAVLLPVVLPTMHLGWGLGFVASRTRL